MEKEKFNVGDHIILKAGKVGKIEEFFIEKGLQMIKYNEYYTPDRTSIGKQEYHSDFELFRTDEIENTTIENISSKCEVLFNFDLYIKRILAYKEKKTSIKNTPLYFVRQKYSVEDDHLAPDLNITCYCEMPFNPDKNFIQCKKCKELVHIDCFLLAETKKCFNQSCDNNLEVQIVNYNTNLPKIPETKNSNMIGNKRERDYDTNLHSESVNTNENIPDNKANSQITVKRQKSTEEDKANEQYSNLSEESKKYLINLISKNEKKSMTENSHVSNEEKSRIAIREKIFNSLVSIF
jgi:hypothetical protein